MSLRHLLLLITLALPASGQGPGSPNISWQMQQQHFQAQYMHQMLQQLHRTAQMQRQQMHNQQMSAMHAQRQAQAQRARELGRLEVAARRIGALPPPMIGRPAGEGWSLKVGQSTTFPSYDGCRLAVVENDPRVVKVLDPGTGKALWSQPLPKYLALDPLLIGDFLIYATKEPELFILDAETGAERQHLKLDALGMYHIESKFFHPRVQFPAIDGTRIYLATYGKGSQGPAGWVYALDLQSGEILWKFEMAGGSDLTPTLVGDRLLVGGRGRVVSLDPATGRPTWETSLGKASDLQDGVLLKDTFLVQMNDKVFALDPNKGSILWQRPLPGAPLLQGEGDRVFYLEARGLVFKSLWLVTLDALRGSPVWEHKLGSTRFPWLQDGRILCNAEETLLALELTTGKPLWSTPLERRPEVPFACFGETLYVASVKGERGQFRAFRLSNGTALWETTGPQPSSNSMMVLTDQGILVLGTDERLVLLK